MATLGKLVMGLFLDSKQAEAGLDKIKTKTSQTARSLTGMGKGSGGLVPNLTKGSGMISKFAKTSTLISRAATGITGAIVGAGAALASSGGAASDLTGLVTGSTYVLAGAKMEDSAIKMAALTGSWAEGVTQLTALRDISKSTGATLESLIDSTKGIRGSGISTGSAVALLESVAGQGELLGGGAIGVRKAGNAMAHLLESGTATEDVLKGLNDDGLPVFKSLAIELTKVTGNAYSARDAIFALRRGTVSSFTGLQAIQNATRSPEAMQAAERFASSFEGQMSRLGAKWQDYLSTLGQGLINGTGMPKILAFANGFLDKYGQFAEGFLKHIGLLGDDPGKLKNQIDSAFAVGQEWALLISKTLVGGAIKTAKIFASFVDAAGGVENARRRGAFFLGNPWEGMKMGLGMGLARALPNGPGRNNLIQDLNQRRAKMVGEIPLGNGQGMVAQVAAAEKGLDEFFQKLGGAGARFEGVAAEIVAMAEAEQKRMDAIVKAGAQAAAMRESFIKTTNDWTREAFEGVASPMERFRKNLLGLFEGAQQRKANIGLLGVNDQAWYQEVLKRKQAGVLQDMLREFSPGDSFIAQRADSGSAAAVESIVRNRFSESNMDPQARIEAAVKRGTIAQERTAEYQQRLLDAATKAKVPNVFRF